MYRALTRTAAAKTVGDAQPPLFLPAPPTPPEIKTGTDGDGTLTTGSGNDTLNGLGGNDVLTGGAGKDALNGGAGSDTASYANAPGLVKASLANPSINSGHALGDTYDSVENLIGSKFNDSLFGNSGANVLEGGAGGDLLNGGAGSDTASYAHASAGVEIYMTNMPYNSGDAAGDTYVSIENLTGTAFDDILNGDLNNNVLTGGLGADTLNGGHGDDTVSYAEAAGAVFIDLDSEDGHWSEAEGDHIVDVENVTGSAFNDVLRGDYYVNILNGGAGDDILEGMDGSDTYNGGEGSDTVTYASAFVGVTVNLASPAANSPYAAGETYYSIENIRGSDHNDKLTGNGVDNVLTGGLGADALNGGAGSDTASYAQAVTGITASLTKPAQNTGEALGDTYGSIENLTGTAFDDILTGDNLANTLTGGKENDVLTGLNGQDVLDGGMGNDVLNGGLEGDTLLGGVGVDTATYADATAGVTVSLADPALRGGEALGDVLSSIENLIGSAFADVLYGDAGDNVLDGGAGKDLLNGGKGKDTFVGWGDDVVSYADETVGMTISLTNPADNTGEAAGDIFQGVDNLTGGSGHDWLIGNSNSNSFEGGNGVDKLEGGSGDDFLSGGLGADKLYGGNGGDRLNGGTGADTFFFDDSQAKDGDIIEDFEVGIDKIDLTGVGGYLAISDIGANDTHIILKDGSSIILWGVHAGQMTADQFILPPPPPGDAEPGSQAILAGTVGANTFNGTDLFETIYGFGGNDTLYGNGGKDVLYGHEDADKLFGGAGDDILIGGAGQDTLNGGAGADVFVLATGDGANTIADFQDGADLIDISGYGGVYSSIVQMAGGAKIVFADGGYVVLNGIQAGQLDAADFIVGDAPPPENPPPVDPPAGSQATLNGTVGANTISGTDLFETINGLAGADTLNGMGGDDVLNGGSESDKLNGGEGDDFLIGGTGQDTLTGGAGADVFVFGPGDGANTITDFQDGIDLIDVSAYGAYSSIVQMAGGAKIVFADGGYVTLTGIQAANLTAADFIGLAAPAAPDPKAEWLFE